MNKFLKLCSCEFSKVWKKKSIKVMIVILLLSTLLCGLLTLGIEKLTELSDEVEISQNEQLENYKVELANNENVYDEVTKNKLKAEIDIYQLAIDNDINLNKTYWKSNVLLNDIKDILEIKYNNISLGYNDTEIREQDEVDKYLEYIKNNQFDEYIKDANSKIEKNYNDGLISEQERNDKLYVNNLKVKYQIGKDYNKEDVWKNDIIEEISLMKESLRTGIDQLLTGRPLTEENIKKYNDSILVNEYRLEHNLKPMMTKSMLWGSDNPSSRKMYDSMIQSITFFILAVLMIVIASTSVGNEITKGTIKFWSFLPVKRWKILLSKFVINTVLLFVLTIIITLVSTLIGNVLFGSSNALPYLYVSDGNVHMMSYLLFITCYYLICAFEIWIFVVFAMMLSTVLRNSAGAIGISLAAYLGGNTVVSILNFFIKADWMKFIPFNNLNLVVKVFSNDNSQIVNNAVDMASTNVSVGFSVVLLLTTAAIMIITMFDSFIRKDLK